MSSELKDIQTTSATGGIRYNKAKIKLSLVPIYLRAAVARVFWASADINGGKYPLKNWEQGLSWADTAESINRHAELMLAGEWLDKESKLPHLWHVSTNCAMLLFYVALKKGTNDLFEGELTHTNPWEDK